METYLSPDGLARLMAAQASNLKRRGGRLWASERRPYCDAPVNVTLAARAAKRGDIISPTGKPAWLELWMPCRKCDKCRVVKAIHWRKRMTLEMQACKRTWFVTLTFRPKARAVLFKDAANMQQRSTIAMRELAAYMKRLRNAAVVAAPDASVRFVAVTEPHKDDYPHIHLLLHSGEHLTAAVIRKGGWRHGFISMKLASDEVASYLVKYVTKEASSVRASLRYGASETPPGSENSGPVTKTSKAKSAGKEKHDLTPESMREQLEQTIKVKVLNREIPLSDGVELLSTVLSLTELEDNETVVSTPAEAIAAWGAKDDYQAQPNGEQEQVAVDPVRDRPDRATKPTRAASKRARKLRA